MTFYITVDDHKTQRDLNKMSIRANDMRPVFRFLKSELARTWVRNFLTQGSVLGPWPPLDFEYQVKKFARHGPLPPLVITGRLARAVAFPEADIGFHHFEAKIDNPYAKFHQEGTRHMPKRELADMTPAALARFLTSAARYVAHGEAAPGVIYRGHGIL